MKWNQGTQYENPPTGSFVARCHKIIDLGTQPVTWQGQTKMQRKVLIGFELPTEQMEGTYNPEMKGRPFGVSKRYTQSLAANARLRQDLEGWAGKKFSLEALASFDPKTLLGKCCQVTMVESEDGKYVNINALAPLPVVMDPKTKKKAPVHVPKQVNPSVYFSLEPDEFSAETLETFSDHLRDMIYASPEYKALFSGESQDAPPTTEPPPADGEEGGEENPF